MNNLKKDLFHTYPRLAQNQEYIVQKGDTLYQISEKFGVSVAEIMEKNQIFDTLIYPNQIIVIPRKAENTVYFEEYITKENDSIASISKNLIANMELLIKYNDLTKLILNANQVLRIPRHKSYGIQEDDNLNTILAKHNMTAEELIYANLEWVRPGQRIRLH